MTPEERIQARAERRAAAEKKRAENIKKRQKKRLSTSVRSSFAKNRKRTASRVICTAPVTIQKGSELIDLKDCVPK